MTTGTDTPSLPSALTALRRKLAVGWQPIITGPHRGTLTVGGLSEDTDGDGKRTRITREIDVYSVALKARHCDTRRALVAVWVHRLGDTTKAGKPRWSLDVAVRGRHENEYAPQHLDSRQLTAYAASRTLDEYRDALKALEVRKTSKTDTTEISTSVPTEEAA